MLFAARIVRWVIGRAALSVAAVAVFAGGAVVAGAAGCSPPTAPESAATGFAKPDRAPDATYVVRGRVTELPGPSPQSELRVHHEPIHDFRNKQGAVVGMNAMIMEFPPVRGLDLRGLRVGDMVAVTFSVWWGNQPGWLATKIEKLPADTPLDLGKARPPTAPAAAPAPPVG